LREALKLPLLVQHYIKHISEHPEMSVREFISMHYLEGIIMDEDYDQDMQLPFKAVNLSAFVITGIFIPAQNQNWDGVLVCRKNKKISPAYSLNYQNPNTKNIFHPPQA